MAGRARKQQKPQNNVKQLTCASCGELKKISFFYVSYSKIHTTGRLPYCKDCLKKMIVDDNGNIDLNNFKKTLELIDRPFLYDIWQTSIQETGDIFGVYMKNIAMPQYRYLTWKESLFNNQNEVNSKSNEIIDTENIKNFSIQELKKRWGKNYNSEQLIRFEEKYQLLRNNYKEVTSMHTEALLKYVRYSVLEEIATEDDDFSKAKGWGELANKAATAAKINPSQLSKADLTEGLNTISELAQAVERAVDIIPILPRFKFRPNDALDFNIWCYVNYERHLRGMPLVEYSDIYKFYDERKADYIKQYGDPYGIFNDDTTEKNRESIINFLSDESTENNEEENPSQENEEE